MNLQMCLCANICICKYIYVNVQANIHAYLVDLKPFLLVKGNQSMVQKKHILISFIEFDQYAFCAID